MHGGQSEIALPQMVFLVALAGFIWLLIPLLCLGSMDSKGTNVERSSRFTASVLPQPSSAHRLERLALRQRLLLVVTLDGALAAYDKYSGVLYWRTTDLQDKNTLIYGGGASSDINSDSGPLYIFEPVGSAPMFAYLPGGRIQVYHKPKSLPCINQVLRNYQ